MQRQRLRYWRRYLSGDMPWDTNITPPELRALIEDEKLPPGPALDLGCGTGTNAIYLAQQGWSVTGIDYIPTAIQRAKHKARQQQVSERTRFLVQDVTQLARQPLNGPFNLVLDIGCLHGLSAGGQAAYLSALPALTAPGAVYLLYAFNQHPDGFGINRATLTSQLEPVFTLSKLESGDDVHADRTAAWYWFTRSDSHTGSGNGPVPI